ncbi:MAG: carbohydrate kinase [Candidatus Limnocylindrales bacterium]|nr:carbohydrate kinase [Candidatus Limnocylindrales bacterium]
MIIVAGEALIDRIVHPDGSAIEVPGGGPFNTARTIGRLGIPVAFLGRLSTDRSGTILRRALAADGVDLSLASTTHAPTTLALAEIDAHGSATYRFQTTDTSAPSLDADAVRAALGVNPAALHLGTLGLVLEPMATALADGVARCAPETLLMVDPNCRPPAIADRTAYIARLHAVLRRADIVKASRDDLAYLWPDTPVGGAARQILAAGPRAVVVTDGPRPVACHTPGFAFDLAVPQVAVVDTVGAGDAFGGALLARWIERGLGRDELSDESALRDAVTRAIEVASLTCQRPGADPPRRAELDWPAA